MSKEMRHIPVMLRTVVDTLTPSQGETVLDATLGLGGHAHVMLAATDPNGFLIGIDADERNLKFAQERLKQWEGRTTFIHGNFADIDSFGLPPVDIILADLGLSSPHVDDPERGFSFREDSPLDMRFDQSSGVSASMFIENASEEELKKVFREFGELWKEGGKLARVCAGKTLKTTLQLKEIVEKHFGFRAKSILPQVFQALRITVNGELEVLTRFLTHAPELLKPGGRIGVISYHSLEDRIVKHMFRKLTTPEKDPITGKIAVAAPFVLITKKPIVASSEEIAENPRARSAKLRAIRRP